MRTPPHTHGAMKKDLATDKPTSEHASEGERESLWQDSQHITSLGQCASRQCANEHPGCPHRRRSCRWSCWEGTGCAPDSSIVKLRALKVIMSANFRVRLDTFNILRTVLRLFVSHIKWCCFASCSTRESPDRKGFAAEVRFLGPLNLRQKVRNLRTFFRVPRKMRKCAHAVSGPREWLLLAGYMQHANMLLA